MPIPIELILATCRTFVSYFAKLNPTFVIPVVHVNNIVAALSLLPLLRLKPGILGDSVVIAIIVFVLTICLSRWQKSAKERTL